MPQVHLFCETSHSYVLIFFESIFKYQNMIDLACFITQMCFILLIGAVKFDVLKMFLAVVDPGFKSAYSLQSCEAGVCNGLLVPETSRHSRQRPGNYV